MSELLSERLSEQFSELRQYSKTGMKSLFTFRIKELIDNWQMQRENLEQSIAAICITIENRSFKLLCKPVQFQSQQIIAINWIAEKENFFAKCSYLVITAILAMLGPTVLLRYIVCYVNNC